MVIAAHLLALLCCAVTLASVAYVALAIRDIPPLEWH